MKKNDPEIQVFDNQQVIDPLNPRDSFYGGSTNAVELYHKIILSSSEFMLISTLRGKVMLILLRLRFLNLSGHFIKLNTICPQNLFLYYTMRLFIHVLLFL